MSLLHMIKKNIRRQLRETLAKLSNTDRQLREQRLISHIQQFLLKWQISQVAVYYPIHAEPSLDWKLLAADLYFPKVKQSGLTFVRASQKDCIPQSTIPVPEPVADHPVIDLSQNTLMLVPGLAFSVSGYRIGYGQGFYDRFLSQVSRTNLRALGVGFSEQLVEFQPEEHDVRLDGLMIASESATLFYPLD